MEFINNGEKVKVRMGVMPKYYWISLNKGDKVELSELVGKSYGFDEVVALVPEVEVKPEVIVQVESKGSKKSKKSKKK